MTLPSIYAILLLFVGSFLRGMMLYAARHLSSDNTPFFKTPAITAAVGVAGVILAVAGSIILTNAYGVIIGIVSFVGFWVFSAIWEPLIDAGRS